MTKKIAFVRKGDVPIANRLVAQQLQENFPQFEVEEIDIKDFLSQRKGVYAANVWHTVREYGREILLRQKQAKDCFFRTAYLFDQIKAHMARKLSSAEYAFSFQMQSLFDASCESVPHFVYTDHTNLANLNYPLPDHGKIYPPYWLQRESLIYQNATRIFTRSSNISRSIVEQYGCRSDKVARVYAGSNVNIEHRALANDNYRNKNILFVGIDWERKGGPELVRAFRQVLVAHPDARLTIVGCRPTIKLANCEVVGRLDLDEVSARYRQASIFCLPTRQEPFGIAIIEALGYKLPVVTTNIGAIPDFVVAGENGYLVSPGDVDSLARSLIELLADAAKCRDFGEKGYAIARENYTWDKVGQRLQQEISMTLGNRR